MKRNVRRHIICAFLLICLGAVACAKTQTTVAEPEVMNETVTTEKEKIINDANADDSGKNTEVSKNFNSEDDTISEEVSIEDRLLILPYDEEVPESFKKVFSENADFDVIFDLGYEVYSRESGSSVELYTEYLSAADYPSGIGSITTNVEEYDCGGPYYSEGWRFPLYWYAYKVMDMDNDGVNELIYRVSPGDSIESWDDYYLIFHEIDGRVYAFATSLYCAPLTEDGLMTIGHGSKDILYKICSFDTERYYIDCLAYYSSIDDSDNPVMVLGDKYVSGEEWIEFYKENYDDKEKAVFKSKEGPIIIQ
ncbi:MAG: hypothetical protein IKR39_06825 [Lachnospiraceae bacterium]|nr:hypothetical protein [Lachnospiraceae bacterium]